MIEIAMPFAVPARRRWSLRPVESVDGSDEPVADSEPDAPGPLLVALALPL